MLMGLRDANIWTSGIDGDACSGWRPASLRLPELVYRLS
jgi:hypothetical protein